MSAQAISLDRMVRAVEKVRERLVRAVAALEAAKVPYAIAGGHAVAAWVSSVDESAVRNTRDVDVLIRRSDLGAAIRALEKRGFVHRHAAGLDVFTDGREGKAREGIHLIFANELVRESEPEPNPGVEASEPTEHFRVLSLEALVRIKLTAFRDKDKTHLRDMIEVGLIDAAWLPRLPGELRARLKQLLDHPE